MKRICINCGKEMRDGQLCDCSFSERTIYNPFGSQEEIQENVELNPMQNPIPSIDMNNNRDFFQNILYIFMEFVKNPSSELKRISLSSEYLCGLFYLGILSFVLSLFSVLRLNKIILYSPLFSKFSTSTNTSNLASYLEISGKDYLLTFGRVLLGFIVLTGLLLVLIRLLSKTKNIFLSSISIIGVSTIPIISFTFLCSILFFIPQVIVNFLVFVSAVISLILCYTELKNNLNLSEKLSFYVPTLILGTYYFSILHLSLAII
jgi:hypothetical protein